VSGGALRSHLARLGVIRPSGHEHFNGSLVVPVHDEAGAVVELYGRKVTAKLRKGTPTHLYLPGPHRGVFNVEALAAGDEVILCESLIDALTFWAAGFRHVTSSYGIEGFGDEHADAFCVVRSKADTESGAIRTSVPDESGQSFRLIPDT
jgi:DNA primase